MKKIYKFAICFLNVAVLPQTAFSADIISGTKIDNALVIKNSDFTFLGGVGYASLKADELVYDPDSGNRISHLIWKSNLPILTAKSQLRLGNSWVISGNMQLGLTGKSKMTDYDWSEKYGFDQDNWSHRSEHSDTNLAHYFNGDIALGYDFQVQPSTIINLHGGFKYTSVKWDSYGGSGVYSNTGFRDYAFNFPIDARVISYKQSFPTAFVGVAASHSIDRWTFNASARAGMAFKVKDQDDHWLRNLNFTETFSNIPNVALEASVNYAVSDRVDVTFGVGFDRYFNRKGDTTISHADTRQKIGTFKNSAGITFQAVTATAGLKYRF